ncbi:MAG: AMP-binding protein [Acidimicrobiales bacterium]|nr:AMP-binding protein [Acidimicrobiales bacterium]
MTTLDDLLRAAPPRVDAVVDGDIRLSSDDLTERASAIAGALNGRGVGHGDRVAFQLPIGWPTVALYRACWQIGVVPVALHPMAGAAQLRDALNQSEPSVILAAPGMTLAENPQATTVDSLTGGAAPLVAVDPDDDALVMFTSGSGGPPKGVVHRHRGLVYKARQSIDVHGFTADDVVLMPAPLAHVSGLLHGVLVPGTAGAKAVLMTKWEPGAALDLIEREGVTWMIGPPTFFIGLMDHPGFASSRVESLRLLSCGGAGVSPAFAERARRELGAVVKRAYGSTEAPTITTSHHDDPPERMIGTDGRAFGDAELRVDEHGELWVRGPELARGYLDPARTADAFVDGWFRTGDLATLDDGWLTITGRLGDRIIRGGENISASEVEQHLEAHPAVHHATAVAEPDERLGERVAAFVIAPEGFDLDTCRAWFADRGAARYTTPERIEIVDEFPVLASGKVDRAALVARL